ncbi:MAG: hypothetical protein DRJ98_00575 [Thermoprotei archaeon]|nr:MAG: hypothetical protein DRJ98_00575 [Thermoprotei archaeon]
MTMKELKVELRKLLSKLSEDLERKEKLKDYLVSTSRRIIKAAGDAVISIHSERLEEADELIRKASSLLNEALKQIEGQIEYLYEGPLPQALKEYVEALTFYRVYQGQSPPSPAELNVPLKPYIYGLTEVVGEARRRVIDSLRKDKIEEAERWLEIMEAFYGALRELELYRSALPDIKHKVDQVRRLTEVTRGDVALATQRNRLRQDLRRLEERLRGTSNHG